MAKGLLPEEGPLRLGPVTLPAGRVVTAGYGSGEPVAWVTVDPVPETGRVWADLSEVHDQTGLVPILLDGLYGDTSRPWDSEEFEDPQDPGRADSLDAGTILDATWRGRLPSADEEDLEATQWRAPFTRRFPGLAPPERTPLTPAERQGALDTLLPQIRVRRHATAAARIGLVAADRPADVLPAIGWMGLINYCDFLPPLTAVLRSWEDRFGARLIDVGFADIRLLVERPPRTLAAAERIAAEHFALADECGYGLRRIPGIAASLMSAPIWAFWWD